MAQRPDSPGDTRHAAGFGLDEPLTLREACDLIFRGLISPATLRVEAARGKLAIERIGRRDFVTIRAIEEMRERCRRKPEAPDCGSSQNDETPSGTPPNKPSGLSETEQARIARAALQATAKRLISDLPNTSSVRVPGRKRLQRSP